MKGKRMAEPRYSVEKKMEIVILALDPRANIDGICDRYGIQRSTLRGWKEKFLAGARQALSHESRETAEIQRKIEDSRKALKKLIEPQGEISPE